MMYSRKSVQSSNPILTNSNTLEKPLLQEPVAIPSYFLCRNRTRW
jgi:hypothetical protein